MAAAFAVMSITARGVSLAALDCRTFVAAAGRSSPFALAKSGAPRKVGGSIARCTLDSDKKESTPTSQVFGGDGWIAENDGLVRGLPLFLGGGALLAVLLNRSLSGIAPVADSSRLVAMNFANIFLQ